MEYRKWKADVAKVAGTHAERHQTCCALSYLARSSLNVRKRVLTMRKRFEGGRFGRRTRRESSGPCGYGARLFSTSYSIESEISRTLCLTMSWPDLNTSALVYIMPGKCTVVIVANSLDAKFEAFEAFWQLVNNLLFAGRNGGGHNSSTRAERRMRSKQPGAKFHQKTRDARLFGARK